MDDDDESGTHLPHWWVSCLFAAKKSKLVQIQIVGSAGNPVLIIEGQGHPSWGEGGAGSDNNCVAKIGCHGRFPHYT